MANRKAGRCARAGQSDEMLGGNVRNEQGRANEEPAYIATCKKIVFRGPLAPRKIHANAEHQREIKPNDDDIRSCQCPVTTLDQ